MINTNKPAPKQVPHKTIIAVYERDNYQCVFCGAQAQGKPHHWAAHNTGPNRANFPLFVHHKANLVCTCYACHGKRGSGDNLSFLTINCIEEMLRKGRKIEYFKNEHDKLSIRVLGETQ